MTEEVKEEVQQTGNIKSFSEAIDIVFEHFMNGATWFANGLGKNDYNESASFLLYQFSLKIEEKKKKEGVIKDVPSPQ